MKSNSPIFFIEWEKSPAAYDQIRTKLAEMIVAAENNPAK